MNTDVFIADLLEQSSSWVPSLTTFNVLFYLSRDHFFDSADRVRVKSKRKEATVNTDRNAVRKGSLGVRWEGARRNDSKLLPTVRMGIDE